MESISGGQIIIRSFLVSQNKVPLIREIICVGGRIEQLIDDLSSLLTVGAGHECRDFGFCGKCSGDVNVHATQECAIIGDR